MRKTLTPVGDGLGIVIDKAILDLLEIDVDTLLEVKTDGEGLIIKPVGQKAQEPVRDVAILDRDLQSEEEAEVRPAMSKAPPAPLAAPPAPAPPAPMSPKKVAPPAPPTQTPKSSKTEGDSKSPRAEDASPPEIVVEKEGKLVMRVPFVLEQMVIGRDAERVDLPLDDRALSREHLRIERRGASIWVNDLGSANGTYLNGQKVRESMRIEAGDTLEVGHFVLRFEGLEERALAETPMLILDGPEGMHRFALVGDEIVIGRSTQCDISIGHRSISRRHFRILRKGEGFEVENLGSQNGIKLNGKRVNQLAAFSQGDKLKVCDFTFELGVFEEAKPNRPKTMLIDASVMAGAAYVDGAMEKMRSEAGGMMVGRDNQGRPDTGEYDLSVG